MIAGQDLILNRSGLQQFYAQHFAYYNSLSTRYQELFTRRCLRFIEGKTIEGGDGFVVTNQIRATVAASAIQLTLGLETWSLDYFESIVIYPGDFDASSGTRRYKGETNMNGYIRLSWKSFVYGYATSHDNLNLGLHEFSHALRFSGVKGSAQDYFFEHYFNGWMASALEAHYDIKNNRHTIFRKYGGANINEFISVCFEHYFESPQEIKKAYPELYYSTAILLNQVTEGGITHVGIRERMFGEKNLYTPGYSAHRFKSGWQQSNLFKMILVVSFPMLINILATGFFSGLSTFFLGLWLLMFFCFDFRYTNVQLKEKELAVQKGLFVFRHRRNLILPSSQLVSVRALGEQPHNREWEITYYNGDGYFYEEHVFSAVVSNEPFVKELLRNKVAYFK